MNKISTSFFAENIDFKLKNKLKIKKLVNTIFETEKPCQGTVSYIFCDDEYLLEMNQHYLKHDDYTDIITFENYDPHNHLMGDVFISIDRAHDNAEKFDQTFDNELIRLITHGALHLCGYMDDTDEARRGMKVREDYFITLYNSNL